MTTLIVTVIIVWAVLGVLTAFDISLRDGEAWRIANMSYHTWMALIFTSFIPIPHLYYFIFVRGELLDIEESLASGQADVSESSESFLKPQEEARVSSEETSIDKSDTHEEEAVGYKTPEREESSDQIYDRSAMINLALQRRIEQARNQSEDTRNQRTYETSETIKNRDLELIREKRKAVSQ